MLDRVVECRVEFVRRVGSIHTQYHPARLVQKQQCGRKHDAQRFGKRLFCCVFPVEPGDLAVTPHIDGDDLVVSASLVLGFPEREVGIEQFLAIGTAILVEIENHALAGSSSLGHIFTNIEKGICKPGRLLGVARIDQPRGKRLLFLRGPAWLGCCKQAKRHKHNGNHQYPVQHMHSTSKTGDCPRLNISSDIRSLLNRLHTPGSKR